MLDDMTDELFPRGEYLTDNSPTVPLCQRHYRLITLYFLVVFTTVDGKDGMEGVYTITNIYYFTITRNRGQGTMTET